MPVSNLITTNIGFDVKTVNFQNSELIAAKDSETGTVYVGVSWICNGIGFTKGQKDYQVEFVQKDYTLSRGCRLLPAGVFDQYNQALALELEFLPIWLAKINISSKIKTDNSELAERLFSFQLKVKDVLAEAFNLKNKDISTMSSLEVLKEHQKLVAEYHQMVVIAIEKEEKIIELKLILSEKDKILEKYKLQFDEGLIFVSQFSNQIGIGVVKFSDILKYLDIVSDSTKTVNSKYSKYFKYTSTYSNKVVVPVLKVNSDGLLLLDDLVNNGLFKINNFITNSNHTAASINSLKRIDIPVLILQNLTHLNLILSKY